jgi:hypothetical protein
MGAVLAKDQPIRRSSINKTSINGRTRLNVLGDGDDVAGLRGRLTAERDKHNEKHRQLSRVVSSCNQWCMQLRLHPHEMLAEAPPLDLKIRTSLTNAIEATRRQIVDLQREIAKARHAPLKRSSQRDAVGAYVMRLAARHGPRINFDVRGNVRIGWAEDIVAGKDDVLGMLCWLLGPDPLLAAFFRDLDTESEADGAMTPQERDEAVDRFSQTLLQLERQECYLIESAARDGTEVIPRAECSPLAVLGLVIVTKEVQQQVA